MFLIYPAIILVLSRSWRTLGNFTDMCFSIFLQKDFSRGYELYSSSRLLSFENVLPLQSHEWLTHVVRSKIQSNFILALTPTNTYRPITLFTSIICKFFLLLRVEEWYNLHYSNEVLSIKITEYSQLRTFTLHTYIPFL